MAVGHRKPGWAATRGAGQKDHLAVFAVGSVLSWRAAGGPRSQAVARILNRDSNCRSGPSSTALRPLLAQSCLRQRAPASIRAPAASKAIVPGSGAAAADPPTAIPPPPCDSEGAPPSVAMFPDAFSYPPSVAGADAAALKATCNRTGRRRGRKQCANPRAAPQNQPPAAADRNQPAAGQRAGGSDLQRAGADRSSRRCTCSPR